MDSGVDIFRADPARVWNAVLGGKDNFAADRELAGDVLRIAPDFGLLADAHEAFRENACTYLASAQGIDQFLDFGLGLPASSRHLHKVIRELKPTAHVVYVEHDLVALRHAEALADDHNAFAVKGDALNPAALLGKKAPVWKILDPKRPIAVLHTVPLRRDPPEGIDELARVMQGYLARVPPGSFIVVTHLLDPETPGLTEQVRRVEKTLGAALDTNSSRTGLFRPRDQIARLFTGHDLLKPGIVPCREWPKALDSNVDTIVGCVVGAIGQKPPVDQAHHHDATSSSDSAAEETDTPPAPADPESPVAPRTWAPVERPEPPLARAWIYDSSHPAVTTAEVPEGTPLRDLPQALPPRLVRLLERQDLVTAEQIAVMTNKELLDLPNVGPASARTIRAATMNALAGHHVHGKAVRLSIKALRELLIDLMLYAGEDGNEELASRAQELREELSPESEVGPRRQRSAPLMGWIYREHVPTAAGLIAELRLYAYEHHNFVVFGSTTELLDKLAPGFPALPWPKHCEALQPDPPTPAGNDGDRHPRPHLQLVSPQPEAASPQ